MLRSLIRNLNKVRVASTSVSTSNISPLQSFLSGVKSQPSIELPINQQENDLECMMNKTSRKTLKKHRKKKRGTAQNLRRC